MNTSQACLGLARRDGPGQGGPGQGEVRPSLAAAGFECELPFPPSLNHLYRVFRGRTVMSAAGRNFRRNVSAILHSAGVRSMEGKLCCSVTVYPPDRRRRDIDNLLKSLLDALQRGGAFPDDSQIVWLITVKATPVAGGRVLVKLSPLSRTACREMCDAAMPEEASCN